MTIRYFSQVMKADRFLCVGKIISPRTVLCVDQWLTITSESWRTADLMGFPAKR